jgi:prolipoprotein diacylglyceryltransferase
MTMTEAEKERRRVLKRKFILGGVVVGVLLSGGYLALTLSGRSLGGGPVPPDPVGIRFVNVILIIAACVLQGSVFGRVAGFLTGKDADNS